MTRHFQMREMGLMSQSRLHPLGRMLVTLLSFSLVAGPSRSQLSTSSLASGSIIETVRGDTVTPSISSPAGASALQLDSSGAAGRNEGLLAGVKLVPLPPNEFQRYVLETSGQALPLFGSNFFQQPPGTFAPQANTPVSPDYRIGPGDELQIRGWGAVDIDVRVTVDRNGFIHIPRIGRVSMNGVRSSQAEDVVRASVARLYRDFQLSVTLGNLKGITVYMVGQARKPGAYNLSSNATLVSALFSTGGPSQTGSMRRVQVKRDGKVFTELDLYAFLSRGDKSSDIRLQDGDTIVIPPATGYVALSGKVSTPAVYELTGDSESLGSILALAGGLPVVADPKRVQLERIDPVKKPPRTVEVFALDQSGLATRLKSGDILSVSSLVPEFSNVVTLRGNVAEPIRTPWREGMRVSDLIPGRGFLMSRASVKRQNEVLLSEADKRRARAGEFEVKAGAGGAERAVGDSADTLAQRIGDLVDEVNMDYAVIERVDSRNVKVSLLPFNLGNALRDPAGADNMALEPGDIVTVFSVTDVRVPHAKRQVYVRVEGEVTRPGIYQMVPGESLPQLLDKAGGLTPDAYLFGAAFYREEVRRAQLENLAQLLRRLEVQMQSKLSASAASVSIGADSGAAALRLQAETRAQQQALERLRNIKPTGRIMLGLEPEEGKPENLPGLRLENQDRLVIPSRPDFVYVLGAVNTESSLIYSPGQSVQRYLELSGLTGGADMDEIFVIRANGSVLSDRGRWFSRVARMEAQPGDVIVLPEKTDHESAWSVFTRNAKDITQIIYQFSLGAAAIKTLRE